MVMSYIIVIMRTYVNKLYFIFLCPTGSYSMFGHLVPIRTIELNSIPRSKYEIIVLPKTALPVYDKSIPTSPSDLTLDIAFEKAFDEIRETLARSPKKPKIPEIVLNVPIQVKVDEVVEEIHWAHQKLKGNRGIGWLGKNILHLGIGVHGTTQMQSVFLDVYHMV